MVMLRDLESCAGNDTLISESDIRRTAHTLPLLLAGADFIFSGFGAIPRYDNMFGPSNFNADDMDDYLVLQRDWGVDGGLRPVDEETVKAVRERAARGRPGGVPRPGACRLRRRARRGGGARERVEGPAGRRPDRAARGRRRDRRRPRRCSTSSPRSRAPASTRRPSGCWRWRASASRATTCRPRRSSTRTCACCRRSPTPTTTPARAPVTTSSAGAAAEIAAIRQERSIADLLADQAGTPATSSCRSGSPAAPAARPTRCASTRIADAPPGPAGSARGLHRALARLRAQPLGHALRPDGRRGAAADLRRPRGGGLRRAGSSASGRPSTSA